MSFKAKSGRNIFKQGESGVSWQPIMDTLDQKVPAWVVGSRKDVARYVAGESKAQVQVVIIPKNKQSLLTPNVKLKL